MEAKEFVVKRKRFSVEQIVTALKQVELGMSIADLTRRLGISEVTFYRWKKQYAGMESDQVRELKQVRDENQRLKKLVAVAGFESRQSNPAGHQLQKIARPALKRQAVSYIVGHYAIAWRRACRIVRQYRSVQYYSSRKDPRTALRARMRELAQVRMRYGYRRLHIYCFSARVGPSDASWRTGYTPRKARNCAANGHAGARWLSVVERGMCRSVPIKLGQWIS
jgi:putative transposase